jgi:hypothetical protein
MRVPVVFETPGGADEHVADFEAVRSASIRWLRRATAPALVVEEGDRHTG